MTLAPHHRQGLVDLAALQALGKSELREQVQAAGLPLPPGLDQGELITALLGHRLGADGLGWVEGTLDLLPDGFGFVRAASVAWAPQPYDAFVSQAQVKKLNLKAGHRLAGPLRAPRGAERFFALHHVERVNDGAPEELARRVPFAERTPILPHARLRLAHADASAMLLAIDALAPWGRGQRVLVTSPPEHDRAACVLDLVGALRHNHGDLLAFVCLLDQRPEDAADARRTGRDRAIDVVATTFDEPPARHVATAELALARAQREVEAGRHVVLGFDSLTAFARACNVEQPPSGRLLCAGFDAYAPQRAKRLFSAARACEEGGSLSIVATAVASDDRIDQAVLAEFAQRGNSEVVFAGDGTLDALRTATRREDLLLPPAGLAALRSLRTDLAAAPPSARPALLAERLRAR